ncbi:MAG: amino acid adenylation domain-containing protein [Pseudonocardia sp.]
MTTTSHPARTRVAAPTWPALFAEQVRREPDATAVVLEADRLSYRELDEQANRLAHVLTALGAGPEQLVALALPRSLAMVVGQVAVLKAGAAYLPLDLDYPTERIAYMLDDAAPCAVVTTRTLLAALPADHPAPVVLDEPDTARTLAAQPGTDPAPLLDVRNAAYVIYTSGTTGRPKAVVLTHTGVAKLVATQTERFGIDHHSRILQFASPSFDVAFWELCLALLSGGRLVVVPDERRVPGPELAQYAHSQGVTFMALPPALLAAMPPEITLPPAVLLAGTERVSPELVARWGRGRRMFNAYGPTEVTVNSTLGESHPDLLRGSSVPIGIPDPRTTAHVLDDRLVPAPEGELYLGGPGVARGYLGWPDLTAARFVADPFGASGERLYRTGDVVRRDADGVLDFRGRVDDQVKIRGYRIEPGEVESVLLDHDAVAQVSVQAREDKVGERRLVAYVVAAAPISDHRADLARLATVPARFRDTAALLTALRVHVQERLPHHLVPAAFVVLDELPVLPNGKLDRAALPAPDFGALVSGTRPRSSREELLCALYSEVLGVSGVGIDDDFFALGGDSIVSIHLVIRARAAGLVLSPRQVFERRTVAELAQVASALSEAVIEDPSLGVGELALTPIMRWLDECGGPTRAFSQSLLIATPVGMTGEQLSAVLDAVVARHDVLRSWIVRACGDVPGALHVAAEGSAAGWIHRRDVADLDGAELAALVVTENDQVAELLDPESGVMAQVVWFDAGPDRPGRLLFVIHHWVIDGVSWRILLPDLAAAWKAVAAGRRPELEPAGTSLRRWARLVDDDARSPKRLAELPLWTGMLSGSDPLLTHRPLDPVRDLATVRRLTVSLPTERTTPLLTAVPAAFHAGINDVLLTALVLAVIDWRGRRGLDTSSSVLLALEGHGREEQVGENVDLSRTLGWFTSIFPVRLDPGPIDVAQALGGQAAAGQALKRIKEQLRTLPDHGVGYGLLRHLNPETGPVLARLSTPQISFNYLGRFTADAAESAWTALPGAGVLEGGIDTAMPVAPYSVEINAFTQDLVGGPELTATWAWPDALLDDDTVRGLAEGWFVALDALVTHTARPSSGGHTPSDLALVSLSQEEIDEFESEWELS